MLALVPILVFARLSVSSLCVEIAAFWAAVASALLVSLYAWRQGDRIREGGLLLVHCLLAAALVLAVTALTDLSDFTLLGTGHDAETGLLLGGLLAFGVVSVSAVRSSRAYPLACAWWFACAACYTMLSGNSNQGIDEQYQVLITGIQLLAAAGAFMLVSRYKHNLNHHQYLSVLAALVFGIIFIIPSSSENLLATLLATMVIILLWLLYRHERRDAPATAVVGMVMLLLFGLSEGLSALMVWWAGESDPREGIVGFLLFGTAAIWVWKRSQGLPRGVYWVALFSFLLLACMQLVPEEFSDHQFFGLLGILLLFISTLYCYAGDDLPAPVYRWPQRLAAAWSGCVFLVILAVGLCSYLLPVYALEENLSPSRLLVYLRKTPLWPGDKRFIEIALKDEGLWPEQVGTAEDSKECLGDHIRKIRPAADRYSAVISVSEEQNYQAGIIPFARGYRWMLDGKRCLLMQVDKNSPAGAAQLKRGDQVLAIDGVAVNSFKNTQSFNRYWDRIHQNHSVALKLQSPAGRVRSVAVPLGRVEQDPPISTVVSSPAGPVGYLYLDSFNDASFQNIRSLFSHFRQAHVRDLVLDLRYNSGGDANKAELLSSLIAGQIHDGKLLIRAETSARYPDRATSYTLKRQPESLSVSRLVVLTTDETCSASEVIINGLRPYLPVYTVGSTTCGKPYLMQPIPFGENILYPITARVLNSRGDDAYNSGIKPDQKATDDFTHELGDPQEEMLKRALQLLAAKPSPPALFK
jgi:C-terminal processing protease CtpA/Prc